MKCLWARKKVWTSYLKALRREKTEALNCFPCGGNLAFNTRLTREWSLPLSYSVGIWRQWLPICSYPRHVGEWQVPLLPSPVFSAPPPGTLRPGSPDVMQDEHCGHNSIYKDSEEFLPAQYQTCGKTIIISQIDTSVILEEKKDWPIYG